MHECICFEREYIGRAKVAVTPPWDVNFRIFESTYDLDQVRLLTEGFSDSMCNFSTISGYKIEFPAVDLKILGNFSHQQKARPSLSEEHFFNPNFVIGKGWSLTYWTGKHFRHEGMNLLQWFWKHRKNLHIQHQVRSSPLEYTEKYFFFIVPWLRDFPDSVSSWWNTFPWIWTEKTWPAAGCENVSNIIRIIIETGRRVLQVNNFHFQLFS